MRYAVACAVVVTTVVVHTAPSMSAVRASVESGGALIDQRSAAPTGSGPAGGGAPVLAWAPGASPPCELVIGFGDSVMSGTAPGIFSALPGIHLDAAPNRQWEDAPELIDRAADAGLLRPIVVFALGTNAGLGSPRREAALHRTLDLVGPERWFVLVTVSSPSSFVAATNELLARVASQRPNVVLADWHRAASAHREYFQSDATHPNMAGMHAYAELLADALRSVPPDVATG